MTDHGPQTVFIFGAYSAMAEASARRFAATGARLVLAGRDAARLEALAADLRIRGAAGVYTHVADLVAADDVDGMLSQMAAEAGEPSVILIFFGYLGEQGAAETNLAEFRRIVRTNFEGAAWLAMASARRLKMGGRPDPALIAVGSVAGDRGRASNYVYGAAKAGLATIVQGLAHQYQSQVRCVVVKPGFVDTPMTAGLPKGGPLWAKPEAIAAIVAQAAQKGGPIVYAPGFWRVIMLIIRALPQTVMNRLKL